MKEMQQNQAVKDDVIDPVRLLKARTMRAKSAPYRGRNNRMGKGLPGDIACKSAFSGANSAFLSSHETWSASTGSSWKGVF